MRANSAGYWNTVNGSPPDSATVLPHTENAAPITGPSRKPHEKAMPITACVCIYMCIMYVYCVYYCVYYARRFDECYKALTMPLFLFSTAVTSITTAVLIPMLPFDTPATILASTNSGKLWETAHRAYDKATPICK